MIKTVKLVSGLIVIGIAGVLLLTGCQFKSNSDSVQNFNNGDSSTNNEVISDSPVNVNPVVDQNNEIEVNEFDNLVEVGDAASGYVFVSDTIPSDQYSVTRLQNLKSSEKPNAVFNISIGNIKTFVNKLLTDAGESIPDEAAMFNNPDLYIDSLGSSANAQSKIVYNERYNMTVNGKEGVYCSYDAVVNENTMMRTYLFVDNEMQTVSINTINNGIQQDTALEIINSLHSERKL